MTIKPDLYVPDDGLCVGNDGEWCQWLHTSKYCNLFHFPVKSGPGDMRPLKCCDCLLWRKRAMEAGR